MCQQTVTLQTAILQQVAEFANNNSVFSVHDITVAIRTKTANGELEIPEVEVQGASFRFDIPHAKVKALFDELYRTGVFDPNYRLDRAFNGTYFEYTPTLLTATTPTAYATTPANVGQNWGATTPVVATPAVPTPAPATVTATSNADTSIHFRVKTYLANCAGRQFQPTLKQVQSAIKRGDASTGYSCESLKTIIEGLGYTVVADPDSLARAQVVTN